MAAQQQGGQSDNSMGILWITGALFIAVGGIWFGFKTELIKFYFEIKLFEIKLISYFTPKLEDVRTAIITSVPDQIKFQDVMQIGQAVGEFLRIPLILLIITLATIVYFTNSTRVFKRTYSMKDMVELEKVNWPQITPVAGLDLVKTNIDQGPWAMATTPMQFCKKNNLLEEHKRQMQEGMTRKEWSKIDVTLRRGLANKVFALQLGPMWAGVSKLPPHTRALFAIFAARYNNDTKAAHELLNQLARTSVTGIDYTGVTELLKKHENSKNIKRITQSHGYVLTVMASMLEAAREDGVQASADFLWVKIVDRRLWYMLNTVGRQTPFVEVAGPFAHWLAEKEIGRPLLVPMIEEATNALELVLSEIVYQPDDKD